MGVKDLQTEVIPADLKVPQSLSNLKGKTVGVDASLYLVKCLTASAEVAFERFLIPGVSVRSHIYDMWNKWLAICVAYEFWIVLCMDYALRTA